MLPEFWISRAPKITGAAIVEIYAQETDPHFVDLSTCQYVAGPLSIERQKVFNDSVAFRKKLGLNLSLNNARKILKEIHAY